MQDGGSMNETENTFARVPRTSANGGVTLVELVFAVAVLAILAAIAIPNFRTFTRSSQVTSAANDLVTALNLARSEAMTRGAPVTVCRSADQATCTDPDSDWDQGWIVLVNAGDDDANSTLVVDINDIIRVYSAPGGNVAMTGGANWMTYNPSGYFTRTVRTDPPFSPTVQVVSVDGTRQIDINTSASGRVNSQRQ